MAFAVVDWLLAQQGAAIVGDTEAKNTGWFEDAMDLVQDKRYFVVGQIFKDILRLNFGDWIIYERQRLNGVVFDLSVVRRIET